MAKERKPETADTEPIIEVYGSHFELIYKTALLNKVELNTTKQINELAVWLQDVAVGLNQISEHGWKVHEIEYYVAKAKKETAEAEYLAWRTTNSTAENNETFESFVMWWNNKNTPQPIVKQKPIKYGANEYALTYIFDLYAIGQQVPINRIEGSFDAKKIKQDASKFPMYDKAPDTFYRAVKSVLEYDLNKPTDLQNISKDWLNAVRNLSTNWVITEQYLKDKNLIGE